MAHRQSEREADEQDVAGQPAFYQALIIPVI